MDGVRYIALDFVELPCFCEQPNRFGDTVLSRRPGAEQEVVYYRLTLQLLVHLEQMLKDRAEQIELLRQAVDDRRTIWSRNRDAMPRVAPENQKAAQEWLAIEELVIDGEHLRIDILAQELQVHQQSWDGWRQLLPGELPVKQSLPEPWRQTSPIRAPDGCDHCGALCWHVHDCPEIKEQSQDF